MSFISLSFLIFNLSFISLFHLITVFKKNILTIQQLIVFSANLLFYSWSDFRFLPFLLYVIIISYIGGIFCKNRHLLAVFIIADLAPLLFFKYVPTNLHTHIIFPLGISFYTFQSISYISDCYNKKIEVEKIL